MSSKMQVVLSLLCAALWTFSASGAWGQGNVGNGSTTGADSTSTVAPPQRPGPAGADSTSTVSPPQRPGNTGTGTTRPGPAGADSTDTGTPPQRPGQVGADSTNTGTTRPGQVGADSTSTGTPPQRPGQTGEGNTGTGTTRPGPAGTGSTGGNGAADIAKLPAEVIDYLLEIQPVFVEEPELEFPLDELEIDDNTLALLKGVVPEGFLSRAILSRLLENKMPEDGGGRDSDPIFALLSELTVLFEDDPSLLIDIEELDEKLDDPNAIQFLTRLAGFDGLLAADEVAAVLQVGPPDTGGDFPRLARIEGVLEGIDVEERLIFVNGDAFSPSAELTLFDRQGQTIDVAALLEIAGSFPKVELKLNDADEVETLRVLTRLEKVSAAGERQEFFGPLALITADKITFQGPRFQVAERTRFLDQDNKQISLTAAEIGQPISVTPGPPSSGSSEPTATKVQLVNPKRPAAASANIVVGNLVSFDGETLELAGPIAGLDENTIFADETGVAVERTALESGAFLRVVTRAPEFGQAQRVAVEVTLLEDGILDASVAGKDQKSRPQDETRIEGFVSEVGSDFIVLAGERLPLSARVQFFDLNEKATARDGLFAGDLIAIDTQPDGRGGFSVTRVKIVDPAAQAVERPGVITALFEAFEGEELVLAGQYFSFASDLKIAGQGGADLSVADLANVEYVRLTASAPRADRGETLPIASEIRVVRAPQAPAAAESAEQKGGKRRVVESFPENGDVEISNFTQVEVTFNGNVSELLFDAEFEFSIFPAPLAFGDLEISASGRSISAEVQLEDDRSYQLVVISKATGFYSARFSTGATIASASVAGRIVAPQELPRNARFVEGESFAVLVENTFAGEVDDFADIEENVVAGIPLGGKDFVFEGVDAGSYLLFAFVGFDLGRGEFVEFEAFFDADGDGEPDAVEVGADERVEVELTLKLPEALEVVSLEPARRAAAVELETAIVVEFNQLASLVPEDVIILPPPLQVGDFRKSDDGTAYALEVLLAEDTIYRVIVEYAEDEEGGALLKPVESVFTTAATFPQLMTITGRLVLPSLPAARRFDGPLLVGLVPASLLEAGNASFESFSEEDIVASTITTSADFAIEDVPAGDYLVAAFARVEVPRGYRAPDPRQRPLRDFDIARAGRFNEQTLEVFDTLELFGFYDGDGANGPLAVSAGDAGVEIFLRGEAKTRAQLLTVTEVLVRGEKLASADGLHVVDSGDAQIGVRFNKELRSDRGIVAIEAALDGRFLRTFSLDDDGRGVRFDAVFSEEAFHRFSLFKAEAKDGSRLQRPLDIGFNTGEGEIGFAQLQGSVTLETRSDSGVVLTGDDADSIDEARVFLFAEDGDELALVSAAEVQDDGSFSMADVLPGSYQVFAELETASGLELKAIYDGNGDGLADIVQLANGAALTGIDIAATAIVATEADTATGVSFKTVPTGGNAGAVLSLDADTTAGNQNKTTLSNVEVGQQVAVDLYVAGAVDINGYAAKLRYDADILDFVSASDVVAGRTNFLRTAGGLALYLSPLLREPELEFGGAVLGATEETAPDSSGFLGRFVFEVRQEFEGAQVFLESIKLNSITGQDELAPEIAVTLAPPVFSEQKKGVISFDFNTAAGDQEVFHKGFVAADSVVDVDVYLNLDKVGSDFIDLSNYSVTVEFDAEQLSFISYAAETSEEANMLTAGGGIVPSLPAITSDNSITFGSAILGPTAATAPDSSGLVGRLTFATTAAFSEVDLLVTKYAIKSVDSAQQEVETVIIGRMSTGEITRVEAGSSSSGTSGGAAANAEGSDFDGDRTVGFGDFFLFADAFGKSAADAGAAFDLDGSGTIDFGDFFVFADGFGQVLGKRVAADGMADLLEGRLALQTAQTANGIKVELRAEALALSGYGVVVEYDASAFRLVQVSDGQSALQRRGAPALLLEQQGTGQVLLLGSGTGGQVAVEGLLAELFFEPLSPEAEGIFRVSEASARSADGALARVLDLGQVEARWVPQVFSLAPNYPNPFNPSTTIRYQLPLDTQVSLEIYDVLGQKVRTLVSELKPAGHYSVSWDSRDDKHRNVAAGVYFYRLSAGDFSQVRKLLLLK